MDKLSIAQGSRTYIIAYILKKVNTVCREKQYLTKSFKYGIIPWVGKGLLLIYLLKFYNSQDCQFYVDLLNKNHQSFPDFWLYYIRIRLQCQEVFAINFNLE